MLILLMILWIGKKIYSLPYRVALDTKTREFQYKLLNRCLVTNTFLCKIGIIPSPACSLCGESDESLEHLFLSCHYTKNFWSEVIKWLVDHKVKIENLSDKDILFGIIGCEDEIWNGANINLISIRSFRRLLHLLLAFINFVM